jgi:predicted N-acetyltransferase YhbS
MEHRNWVPTSELLLDENISYGAFIDNRLVGFITMADNFIRLLYVDDDFHGLGIGTSLINEVCSTIDLDYISTCSTLYAHDFYKKLGFVDTHGLVNDERGYVYYPMEKNVRVDVRK